MAIFNTTISGGGTTPSGKYQMLQRIKDDSNNEIGTVVGFRKDANNNEYAVVCLDAQYRASSGNYCSDSSAVVTDLPAYTDLSVYDSTDTATFTCTKILDYCTAGEYTSDAVTHCRNQSFAIDNVTYYGQLPTLTELLFVFINRTSVNNLDASASSYPGLVIEANKAYWSSTQNSAANGFQLAATGRVSTSGKYNLYGVVAILELPNA